MKRLGNNTKGLSALIATMMTIVVLLVLGGVMYAMVTNVTPGGMPAMGALTSTKYDSGNYTVRVIALTSLDVERDKVSVIISPDDSSIEVGTILGAGDLLRIGDAFTLGNLQPGTTYTIAIRYEATESVIASIEIYVC
jgi:hypothetical protein